MNSTEAKTKLKDHRVKGRKIIPPLAELNMQKASWIDDRLPEMLWAILLVDKFPRNEILKKFADVVIKACELKDTNNPDWRKLPLITTMSGISTLSTQKKQQMIKLIASDLETRRALVPMLLLKNLPARKEWEDIIKLKPDNNDWNILGKAIAGSFFHQFQKATDCRWVTALYMVKSGFVTFTSRTADSVDLILDYPNHDEEKLRMSRPTVRSLEISLSMQDFTYKWPKEFWDECFVNTKCIPRVISREELKKRLPPLDQILKDKKRLQEINQNTTNHFWNTLKSSDKNPKHEVTFGIVLYAIDIATSMILLGAGRSSFGRMALRALVECLINLKYLSKKDDELLWQTFLNHGMGQAKLILQRTEEDNKKLEYLDLKNLHQIANDDVWTEFLTIDIGNWDDKNLRKRAIEVSLKDKYDDYYTWPSSYSHGQWGAIRESVLDLCGNPLHRFHRIPLLYALNLSEAHDDIFILLTNIIDLLYSVYPKDNKG